MKPSPQYQQVRTICFERSPAASGLPHVQNDLVANPTSCQAPNPVPLRAQGLIPLRSF